MSKTSFLKGQLFVTPPEPTNSFAGKTIIVTGANTGLGLDCVKYLVKLDAERVILACRSVDKGTAAAAQVSKLFPSARTVLDVWYLDLARYDSILDFAKRCKTLERLDAVVENAGILAGGFELAEKDESTITVNVVSAVLLTILLLPKLRESAERFGITPYVSVVSSIVHALVDTKELVSTSNGKIFETLSQEPVTNMPDRYNLSKLLVLCCMRELSKHVEAAGKPRIIINNPAPGWSKTELFRNDYDSWPAPQKFLYNKFARPSNIASRTLVHGISAGPESQGQYLSECIIKPASGFVRSKQGFEFQSRLWAELMNKLEAISPIVRQAL